MDGWFLEQLEQPQPAPALQGETWRSMDLDAWLDQPVTIRAAQHLLHDAESGGSRALDLIRARHQQQTEAILPGAPGHRIRSLHDLAPSGRAVVLTVRRLRAASRPVRTGDVRRELSSIFSPDTIANRLRKLRQEGFVTKRGQGWHLTDIAAELAQHQDGDQHPAMAA
jgi:hypothetical protein